LRTLSVSTSPITSPEESLSPSFFVQRAILPAVIVGDSAGIVTTEEAARAARGAEAEATRGSARKARCIRDDERDATRTVTRQAFTRAAASSRF